MDYYISNISHINNTLQHSENCNELLSQIEATLILPVLKIIFGHWRDKDFAAHLYKDQCVICNNFQNLLFRLNSLIIHPLINMLEIEQNIEAEVHAIQFLGNLRNGLALSILLKKLKSNNDEISICAAFSLGQLQNIEALHPLIEAIKERNKQVRLVALEALANLGDKTTTDFIIALLKDEDNDIKNTASQILGIFGDTKAIEPLTYIALNDNGKTGLGKAVKITAKEAIQLIKAQHSGTILLPQMKYYDSFRLLSLRGTFS